MNGDLKGTGELKRKHVNTKIKQRVSTGSSYLVRRDLGI